MVIKVGGERGECLKKEKKASGGKNEFSKKENRAENED